MPENLDMKTIGIMAVVAVVAAVAVNKFMNKSTTKTA